MNLPGIVEPDHARPRGGGPAVLPDRRRQDGGLPRPGGLHPRPAAAAQSRASPRPGLSVLMRYTLRLLTLDQLSRAATLICALELERQKDPDKLGDWPFEIGLWVGRAATPNRMGRKGDDDPNSARSQDHRLPERRPQAVADPARRMPLVRRRSSSPNSFQLVPNPDDPTDLRVTCVNRDCDFTRNQPLPILAVDEPIYRRLPCFLIATVDKFAAMPWTGQVGGFFGRVDRHDKHGFYGPCEPNVGQPLPGAAAAARPDHPGRAAPDLRAAGHDGRPVRVGPRRAVQPDGRRQEGPAQDRRLDGHGAPGREPDPGPVQPPRRSTSSRRPVPTAAIRSSPRRTRPSESHARLYLGVAAQGRSLKVVMLRTYLALLGAAQKCVRRRRRQEEPGQPRRPLHDAARLLQQPARAGRQPAHRRGRGQHPAHRLRATASAIGETEGLFANRTIAYEVGRADLPRAAPTRSPRPSAGWPCRSTRRTAWTWPSPRT